MLRRPTKSEIEHCALRAPTVSSSRLKSASAQKTLLWLTPDAARFKSPVTIWTDTKDEAHAIYPRARRAAAAAEKIHRRRNQSVRRGMGRSRDLPGARSIQEDGAARLSRRVQAGG